MTRQYQPRTAPDRKAAQERVLQAPAATPRSWQGLTDEPTSPRENQPADGDRVSAAREDFERVLGH
ncbi:MAG: hypothetical protein ACXWF9_08700 [Solirubrobacterales bacterium]